MGQALDIRRGEPAGPPFVVVPRLLIGFGGGHPRAAVSVSQNGVLAYRTRVDTGLSDLAWFDRSGKRLESVGEAEQYSNPTLSPDEKKMVVSRLDPQVP